MSKHLQNVEVIRGNRYFLTIRKALLWSYHTSIKPNFWIDDTPFWYENLPGYRFETQIHIQTHILLNTILKLATKHLMIINKNNLLCTSRSSKRIYIQVPVWRHFSVVTRPFQHCFFYDIHFSTDCMFLSCHARVSEWIHTL